MVSFSAFLLESKKENVVEKEAGEHMHSPGVPRPWYSYDLIRSSDKKNNQEINRRGHICRPRRQTKTPRTPELNRFKSKTPRPNEANERYRDSRPK
jgi:hypothetical protein